jgi:hypothetical protein
MKADIGLPFLHGQVQELRVLRHPWRIVEDGRKRAAFSDSACIQPRRPENNPSVARRNSSAQTRALTKGRRAAHVPARLQHQLRGYATLHHAHRVSGLIADPQKISAWRETVSSAPARSPANNSMQLWNTRQTCVMPRSGQRSGETPTIEHRGKMKETLTIRLAGAWQLNRIPFHRRDA